MGKSKKRKHKKLKQEYRRDCNVCNSTWFYSGEDIGNEDYKEKMEYYQKISTLGSMLTGKLSPSAFLQTEDRVDLQRCQECGSRDTIITKVSSPKSRIGKMIKNEKQRAERQKLKNQKHKSRIGKMIKNEKQSFKTQKVENIKSEDQRAKELRARDIAIAEAIEDIEFFIKGAFSILSTVIITSGKGVKYIYLNIRKVINDRNDNIYKD